MDLWPQMLLGVRWSVGNGSRVRFWMDYWIMNSPLIDIAAAPVPNVNRKLMIYECRDQETGWKWELFAPQLPQQALLSIAAFILPDVHSSTDKIYQGLSSSIKYIIHTLRDYIMVKEIWKKLLPGHDFPNFFLLNLEDWMRTNLMFNREAGISQIFLGHFP